ncbi:hypothetical protein GGR58DRAFT_526461 [Xylaria digitata]|nr:hypothetical protein GGR58DRAFT_526461 [Xylaria digitata]
MPARQRRRQQQQRGVFHLFGQLPTELRLQIWAHTWKPRTISLYAIDRDHFLLPGGKNLLPASAYVNRESRSETLRHYKRCFSHPDKTDFRWFNFRLDTLCLAASWPLLNIDPNDLRQVQRLIAPDEFPGATLVETPCRNTWLEPVTESFESPVVREVLEEKYPSLKELTLTTNRWHVVKPYYPQDQPGNGYAFERHGGLGNWGHMRTTYISGLKVRHSPSGRKTYRQRYCCQLSKEDAEILELTVIESLLLL